MVLFLAPAPARAQGWTLDRVLAAVRSGDPGMRAARASGAAGRARAAQSWAMLAPQVTAVAGFTRGDDPAMLFSQKLWQGRFGAADFALDHLNHPEAQSAFQVGVMVDQSLWDGGQELSAPGLARHGGRAATALERAAVADRLLAAVESYVAAVRARAEAGAAEQALASARATRAAALDRHRMGQAPDLDTLRAMARESEARVRFSGARQGLEVATAALSRLVRAEIPAESLVVDTLPIAGAAPRARGGEDRSRDPSAAPNPAWIAAPGEPLAGGPPPPAGMAPEDAAAEHRGAAPGMARERGELAAARETAAAAALESRTAGLRLLPSLHSRLAVTQYRSGAGGSFEPRWWVALSAELPLFDGTRRLQEWRGARARAAEAEAGAQRLALDLATALDAARAAAAAARDRRSAARDGRAAAEEALRLATERYRAGLLPLSELLATDAEASAARAVEIEASSAETLAQYRLLHAMGDLQ